MNELMEQFNEFTDGKFEFLRLSSVDVNVKKHSAVVNLIYPEEHNDDVKAGEQEIKENIIKALKSKLSVTVKLKLSHLDGDFLIYDVLEFLTSYPAIAHTVTNRDLSFDDADGKNVLNVKLPKTVLDYYLMSGLDKELNSRLYNNYCENITVNYIADSDIQLPDADEENSLHFEYEGGRVIRTINVDSIWGAPIYDAAGYISDAKITKETVLCGKISQLKTITYLSKNSEEKQFCKFILTDPTGEIQCIAFPPSKSPEKLQFLQVGKEIVAKGEVVLDNYQNKQELNFKIKAVSFCTLPKDFKINRIKCSVNKEYHHVFPQPYVDFEQAGLFDVKEEIPEYLLGKTFCIYDIETTGLVPAVHQIIEIGAVKLDNGVFTECFSTFIDPQCLIPEGITKITGISNADVKGAPLIGEVLPDFFKFTQDTIMVGQNSISFDFPFISAKAKEFNIYFENQQLDTMILARKYMPELSRFSLSKLSAQMGVVNEKAHRALSDAIATAKVFIKLAKYIKNQLP